MKEIPIMDKSSAQNYWISYQKEKRMKDLQGEES